MEHFCERISVAVQAKNMRRKENRIGLGPLKICVEDSFPGNNAPTGRSVLISIHLHPQQCRLLVYMYIVIIGNYEISSHITDTQILLLLCHD